MHPLLIPIAAAAATSMLLTPALRSLAIRRGYVDVPNDRSSHQRPTPKTGGYAILFGVAVSVCLTRACFDSGVAVVLIGAFLLAVVAFADDHRALPRLLRLLLQTAIAVLVVWVMGEKAAVVGHGVLESWWITAIGVLWLVGIVNTYNFMDGLNGIAGGAALATGSILAVLALARGDLPMAILAASVSAAVLGFLPFNLPSGSIFMGDSGSTALGLIFGSMVLGAAPPGTAQIAAALPLTPFVLDAGATVVRRALCGERFFSTPHRSHYYQWLQQLGWSHTAVAVLYGSLTLAAGIVSLAFDQLDTAQRVLALAAILCGHILVFACIQARWSKRVRASAEDA